MMMNGQVFCSKCQWPNLRYYAGIRLEGLNKTKKTPN
jgi:hypothetical protein